MKKLTLLLILTVVTQITVISQGCLPNGITFSTQTEIDNFQTDYPNCTEIEGAVYINDSTYGNITNLEGLNVLSRIGGQFTINDNDMLISLAGLESLDSVDLNLIISNNNSLTSIANLESLCYVKGIILIEENTSLLTLEGLDNFDTIAVLNIIGNESLENLFNLSNLKRVTGEFLIENNQSLSSLSGLENLIYAGEDVKIFNNDLLTDLNGLNNLEYIVSLLKIRYNDQLSSLDGLENLDTINSGISINDNLMLSSLESINNSYFNFVSIYNNPILEVCNINSICNFLSIHSGEAVIHDNSIGCNSVEEVEEFCLVQVSDFYNYPDYRIYPNPAKNELTIIDSHNSSIENSLIYNSLGQVVKRQIPINNKIDIFGLEHGIYIVELASDGLKYRFKFIKE
jgi:hypothetical protein